MWYGNRDNSGMRKGISVFPYHTKIVKVAYFRYLKCCYIFQINGDFETPSDTLVNFSSQLPDRSDNRDEWRCNLAYYFLSTYNGALNVTGEIRTFFKVCSDEN